MRTPLDLSSELLRDLQVRTSLNSTQYVLFHCEFDYSQLMTNVPEFPNVKCVAEQAHYYIELKFCLCSSSSWKKRFKQALKLSPH